MKAFTTILLSLLLGACAASEASRLDRVVRESDRPLPPFTFDEADEAFLDDVQRGAFNVLWNDVSPEAGMALDRTSASVVSVAGVGFQLSAIPVGVERGWITEAQGRARVERILGALLEGDGNTHRGLFYHFLDGAGASPPADAPETIVSTIDSALLFSGIMAASTYFGGNVRTLGDRLLEQASWRDFVMTRDESSPWADFLSLGWDPATGDVLPWVWADAADEHRLVTFLAVAMDDDIAPATYYKLRRRLGTYADLGAMVWFPYSGALFTAQFAHCWIDHRSIGADDPGAFGYPQRAPTDFWENSRRLTRMHRLKAIENPEGLATPDANRWGMTASDVEGGYGVAHLYPDPLPMPDARPGFDTHHENERWTDQWGDGTVAPYAAGTSIMFEPRLSIEAMRHLRGLESVEGVEPLWDDPARGGVGFRDAFRLDTSGRCVWVASDSLAIDQGPLLLGIENARTGMLWDLFHAHPVARQGMERLGLERSMPRGSARSWGPGGRE